MLLSQKCAAPEIPSATAPDEQDKYEQEDDYDLDKDHRSILDRLVADPVLPKKSAVARRAIVEHKSPQLERDTSKIRFYDHGKEIDEPLFLSEADLTESETEPFEQKANYQSPTPALPVDGSSSFRISPFFSKKVFPQKKLDGSSQTPAEPSFSKESQGIPFITSAQRQQEKKYLEGKIMQV